MGTIILRKNRKPNLFPPNKTNQPTSPKKMPVDLFYLIFIDLTFNLQFIQDSTHFFKSRYTGRN